jgi:hypothetical protein
MSRSVTPRLTDITARWTVVVAAVLLISSCGERGGEARPRAVPEISDVTHAPTVTGDDLARRRLSDCAVTPPNHRIPPGQADNPGAARAPYHGNGQLWTVLPDQGILRKAPRHDGSIREKFPWWRGVHGRLSITGRRLDQRAPPLRAQIPDGYGTAGFQATGLIFPEDGCWTVTANVEQASLTFVTLVAKAAGQ